MEEIIIDIGENGDVRFEGKGFVGPECEALTKELEEFVGVVEKREYKPEYRQSRTRSRTRVR